MTETTPRMIAVDAHEVPAQERVSGYPEPFFSRVKDRTKRRIGDFFGLKNFGVNQTTIAPGSESSVLHRHTKQDELVYILAGNPTLVTESTRITLAPGMCAGFPANGEAHHLINETDEPVVCLEIGDRTPGDEGIYPQDDLKAELDSNGKYAFLHKDGTPY